MSTLAAQKSEEVPIDSMIETRRTLSVTDDLELKGDHTQLEKVDKEIAKYASQARIDISPEENARLRRLIDRRVLVIMIATYFLQAIDKGTLSFSSIMGLPKDTGLLTPDGHVSQLYSWLTTCIYIAILVVEYPQVRMRSQLHYPTCCRKTLLTEFNAELHHSTCSYCEILGVLHSCLGNYPGQPRRVLKLHRTSDCSYTAGDLRIGMSAGLRRSLGHVVSTRGTGSPSHILVHDERSTADRRWSASVSLHSDHNGTAHVMAVAVPLVRHYLHLLRRLRFCLHAGLADASQMFH